ncbi:uncharacterized protein CC84DRAFT_439256 [Paraphaeosphaeria sporulosa]|uniref:Uncharacterized protein n=1 Tax=Paraphaeosphaeria sporulosa TaxID=1460663 RepID=A0A177CPQ2_9PLEO|nr:uncharacterized protein CC84DRAFT_439256 [Paraphaeosphaeria sporulosa]OAG09503.1 hypothetical protein CC84DRAFT_439256 [Paraphaeosphaeria sporulosa]
MILRGTLSAPTSRRGEIVSRFCAGTAISSISLLYGTKPGPRLPALWVLCGLEDIAQLGAVDAGSQANSWPRGRVLSRVDARAMAVPDCTLSVPFLPGSFSAGHCPVASSARSIVGLGYISIVPVGQQLTRFLSRICFTREKLENHTCAVFS